LQDLIAVIVVEDDPLVQGVLEETLSDGGFEVVIASSGEEAVTLLDDAVQNYRAIITDINLGSGMTGWEVAQRSREINPEFPVVYMSGDSATYWASKGVPNSIMLSKPFAPTQLVMAVSQLLNSGRNSG
jgi:DNA-binding response OmpR family regulator